ncbi:hypothetical protein [Bacillus mycoides]|uniref:hypothetical protein n=1 Tax=Bacillus mycoides TaxID=1405 RepID=UPI003D22F15C
MSFEMKPEIKAVLEKIRFVDRYKNLSENFRGNPNDLNDRLEDYDIEKVNEIFKRLGYVATFDKKEKFFKVGVIDNSPNYMIWFNIILEYGMTEFIWVVYHNDEVRLGSPWSVYSRLLINPRERIKKPVYRSYEELEDILKEAFLMYDDFKSELISVYSKQ